MIGFVLDEYPKHSETFILQEILGLEARGLKLAIFALSDPREPLVQAQVGKVAAPITYLPVQLRSYPWRALAAHCRWLLASPRNYLAALRTALRLRPFRQPGWWHGIKDFLLAGVLAQLAQRARVERLHAHFALESAVLAHVASILSGLPFSFSVHAFDLFLSSPAYLASQAEGASWLVTCSEHNQRLLARHGVRARLVYHGVDLERFRPPRQPRAQKEKPCILAVGRLVKTKGFHLLLEACSRLGQPYRLQIAGEGPEGPALRRLAGSLQVEVEFLGMVAQDSLIGFYQNADIFALPACVAGSGDRDGLPNVLLEAMACGLPVVTTAVSAIPELVEVEVVPQQDVQALRASLDLLLGDLELRRRQGASNRQRVEEAFGHDHHLDRLAAMFSGRGDRRDN